MKKKMKKLFVVAGIALALGGASTVYAANDFTFNFINNVIGKTEFKLKNKNTTCGSRADTYKYNTNSYANFTGKYRIDLNGKGLFQPNYDGVYQKADGYVHTTKYGKVKKNTYTVDIGSNSQLPQRGGQIKGSGQIDQ